MSELEKELRELKDEVSGKASWIDSTNWQGECPLEALWDAAKKLDDILSRHFPGQPRKGLANPKLMDQLPVLFSTVDNQEPDETVLDGIIERLGGKATKELNDE
jgi:hypothetical protein